ncbi:replication endonuclease [Poseidonibacter lekithochrous]|uniref:replication endonuclease n=1 Tax=Poseidonibacter TaxID=2321187 RepID=UPI001C0952C4|nr:MULTISPECIES: replication endonuclease [Poseidonibacter]MBU3014753.1 replication endonuclease [Poseidonibacter lekithochrous]MDO6828051.1 replication endonuclease [Poseidonibacter sp. 1_MG-2023]
MYGITKEDIIFFDEKLKKQKQWIIDNLSDFDFGENKTALDFTYSANINPEKYFAEMNNRINSIFDYAKELGLKPVFITLTAPSKYHAKNRLGQLKINPNETAKELTQIWNKFTNIQVFQRLRKDVGFSLPYFRVYEPHKSGVPHMHAMLFLPKEYILEVKNKYYEYFTNKVRWGNNRKSLDFKYTWYNSAGGAVAYIMKYVTKTFKNENDKSIQYASYWYMKHNIRRFLCSRSLRLPITIYRKVRHFFKSSSSYLDVSRYYSKDNQSALKRVFNDNTFSYMKYNVDTQEVEEVILWEKNAESVIHKRIKSNRTFKLAYKKEEYKKALTVYVNEFEKYSFSDTQNKFMLLPIIPRQLKDYQLEKYYSQIKDSIEFQDTKHLQIAANEMVKRGFLDVTYQVTITNDLYTEKEEYIDLETGEFKIIDVVKTAEQLGF